MVSLACLLGLVSLVILLDVAIEDYKRGVRIREMKWWENKIETAKVNDAHHLPKGKIESIRWDRRWDKEKGMYYEAEVTMVFNEKAPMGTVIGSSYAVFTQS